MPKRTAPPVTEIDWEQSALDYSRRLPLEYYMHSVPQKTQEAIFDFAFALVNTERPDIQPFGDLLIQYLPPGRVNPAKVVPDNMVVLWKEKIQAKGSFIVPQQPTKPFWVLEYLSKSNERKDYEDSYVKYERELQIPYYLLFHPEKQELELYHYDGENYVEVAADETGRVALPEIEVKAGILDRWLRFWFRDKLLPWWRR